MTGPDNGATRKPTATERWNAKSAVDKRLTQDLAKKKFMSTLVFFIFAPLVGGAMIVFDQQNWLWVPGTVIMVVGVLGWVAGPFIAAAGVIYAVFHTVKPDIEQTFGKAGSAVPSTFATPGEGTDPTLGPILARLSALQIDLAARRRKALVTYMPVVVVAALVLCYFVIRDNGFNIVLVALLIGLPLIFGMAFISGPFQGKFRETFKADVLPSLLARHGQWDRRSGYDIELSGAAAMAAVPIHSIIQVDDAFVGTHRNVPVEVAELMLLTPSRRAGRRRRGGPKKSHHSVLAITIHLDRPVPAPSAVIDAQRDQRYFQSIAQGMQAVELEDVVFNSVYDVYSSDQIGARALLTPAVMQRVIEVADGKEFLPPTLYAREGKLQIFLTTYNERNLFEPGAVAIADMNHHVESIDRDLGNAFAIVDTVIDMAGSLSTPAFRPDNDR